MLQSYQKKIICILCASHTGSARTAKAAFSQASGDSSQQNMQITLCFSRYTQPRHTNQAKCIKSEWFLGESFAQKPLCGLAANIVNTDLTVELWLGEENETRLEKTASQWEWLQASVTAHKLKDNHNTGVDMPDKSDWLCRFQLTNWWAAHWIPLAKQEQTVVTDQHCSERLLSFLEEHWWDIYLLNSSQIERKGVLFVCRGDLRAGLELLKKGNETRHTQPINEFR